MDKDYKEYAKELICPYPAHTLQNFMERCLEGCNPEVTKQAAILNTLFNLAGTEIEAEEISCGLILTNNTEADNIGSLSPALIHSSYKQEETSTIGSGDADTIRDVVDYMKEKLLGWTPGHYEQPVIVCDAKSLEVKCLKILMTVTRNTHTPHEAYIALTENQKAIAIWVKPAASIRIYGKGRLLGQIMRLRDAGGWAARNINDMCECVKDHSVKGTILADDPEFIAEYFIYPAIALSEERKGGSIFVVPKDTWRRKKKEMVSGATYEFNEEIPIKDNIKETELKVYLEQDGCVVLSAEDGCLLAVGNYFVGHGGRKSIANDVCQKWHGTQAIVISQDGPIRFYSSEIKKSHGRGKEKTHKYLRLDFFRHSSPR